MKPSLTLLVVALLVWAFSPDACPALTRPKERPAGTEELRASGSASGKA